MSRALKNFNPAPNGFKTFYFNLIIIQPKIPAAQTTKQI